MNLQESITNISKSIDKTSFSSISYKPIHLKLTKEILSIFYDVFILNSDLNKEKVIDIPMEKSFLNFIYWILVKSAESYYGDSLKTEVPYTPYF